MNSECKFPIYCDSIRWLETTLPHYDSMSFKQYLKTHKNKESEMTKKTKTPAVKPVKKVKKVNPLKTQIREKWLMTFIKEAQKTIFTPAGIKVPLKKIKITCGFPPKGGARSVAIGVCYPTHKGMPYNQLFISPKLGKKDMPDLCDTIIHEVLHAVDNCVHGHKKAFVAMAKACHLEGTPYKGRKESFRATRLTKKGKAIVNKIVKKIGTYPHKEFVPFWTKDSTRMIKLQCTNNHPLEPQVARMSRAQIYRGLPMCGVCALMDDDYGNPTMSPMFPVPNGRNPEFDAEEIKLPFDLD